MNHSFNVDEAIRLKILFVGIGNLLRRDDGVGVHICGKSQTNDIVNKLNTEVSIENYIGKINETAPDLLILIDCVDFGRKPGYFSMLPAEKLQGSLYNTHNISLKRLSDFFKMQLFILGIQPESIAFGENISYIVKNSADMILKHINKKEVHHGC